MKPSALLFVSWVALICWSIELSAQTEFTKAKLVFSNGKVLTAELADTPETQLRGLMGRVQLSENAGMLFIFPSERQMSFWMRNTYIPLSIGFFDRDRRLMSIKEMAPQVIMATKQNLRRYVSERPGLYALEVNQGWFEKNQVVEGMSFRLTAPQTEQEPNNP